MADKTIRKALVAESRRMNALGLNQGTSGNLSARHKDVMLITPSGLPYEDMGPDDIAAMPLSRDDGAWDGPHKPSSEWRIHLDLMKSRSDVGAVVHCHATYATVLSMLRREIPACHYMIAAFGGPTLRCADYATFGTSALSDNALKAMAGRNGCLLANHGMLAAGPDLARAMWLAVELETLARQYYHALLLGEPVILSDAEIAKVQARFADYGRRESGAAEPAAARRKGKNGKGSARSAG